MPADLDGTGPRTRAVRGRIPTSRSSRMTSKEPVELSQLISQGSPELSPVPGSQPRSAYPHIWYAIARSVLSMVVGRGKRRHRRRFSTSPQALLLLLYSCSIHMNKDNYSSIYRSSAILDTGGSTPTIRLLHSAAFQIPRLFLFSVTGLGLAAPVHRTKVLY